MNDDVSKMTEGEVCMLRRGMWLGLFLLVGGLLIQSGCTDQASKPTGGTTVSPGVNNKPGAPNSNSGGATAGKTPDKGTSAEGTDKTGDDTKPLPPPDAGSTTGGGVELR